MILGLGGIASFQAGMYTWRPFHIASLLWLARYSLALPVWAVVVSQHFFKPPVSFVAACKSFTSVYLHAWRDMRQTGCLVQACFNATYILCVAYPSHIIDYNRILRVYFMQTHCFVCTATEFH